ncbi:MAG: fructose bisphosphate aldolase [Ilumatobacteraceae bacterium]|nr:fructose bisphosphate aldolase [Ilumatobacteraceae bacterium]
MLEKVRSAQGFIAALDQSGGSTPKALRAYGVADDQWSNDDEMFDLIHQMRTRIVTCPAFTGERILAAILFEQTMDRQIEGRGSAEYLWSAKRVVPFLKVDKGLADEADGVQLMKPIPGLDELVARAVGLGVFGTKMRSVVKAASESGIAAIVDQQFAVGEQILDGGLVPILEPEVDITIADKAEAEAIMRDRIIEHLDGARRKVMLKLSIPSVDDFYRPLIEHDKVLRVVALSGGYDRAEANERLARNHGMIASFSRALAEGITAEQTDAEFNAEMDEAIGSIFAASIT